MVNELGNVPDEMQPANPLETVKIETFEGIGELTLGVGSTNQILATAVVLLNHPQVNRFLLAQKLKMSDRITKTKIFPRGGMALPDGETYKEPSTEEKKEN